MSALLLKKFLIAINARSLSIALLTHTIRSDASNPNKNAPSQPDLIIPPFMENHVPHFAVIFTSKRRPQEGDGYPEMAAKMDALAREQPGFLGVDSVSSPVEGTMFLLPKIFLLWRASSSGTDLRSAITVSYWQDEESIRAWKRNLEHLLAQKRGKENWYLHYEVRVAKVERMYSGDEILE